MGNKNFLAILLVVVAVTLIALPQIWVYVFLTLDFYTPWKLFESGLYSTYHQALISTLSDKPEIPLNEITKDEATWERVYKETKGFTFPLVIRGLMGNTTAVQNWGNPHWWVERYGSEEMLCGFPGSKQIIDNCTVSGFFDALQNGTPFYVSGASTIVEKHPELHDMIDNEAIRAIEPGPRVATQIFMGLPDMGSDVHCAIGINIFRQVVGQKKWWFIPPHQTAYLKPSININGFSAHSLTRVGVNGVPASPWLNKLVRYTTVVGPGDVLINPPWFWHGIRNLGEIPKGDLVMACPTRYGRGGRNQGRMPSFNTNFFLSSNAFFKLFLMYGFDAFKEGFKPNLQKDIDNNRRGRDKKELLPEDEDSPLD